jgi:preprotein translocase subunit SecG
MKSNKSQLIAVIILVAVLVIVGVLIGNNRRDMMIQEDQRQDMMTEQDTSGPSMSDSTDTAAIQADLEASDFGSLDEDMK